MSVPVVSAKDESRPAVSPAQCVYVRQLVLSHYRNYSRLKRDFTAGRIVLTGENGAGKTNLLEALSLLSPGRGLRRAAYGDIAAAGGDSSSGDEAGGGNFAVSAQLVSPLYGDTQIGTGLVSLPAAKEAARPGKALSAGRRVYINGAAQPAESLAEYCRIIWLTPAQDGLFSGPAGDRRRFWDRLILALDSRHARRVIDYDKAMRARNRLLAEGSADMRWLGAIEAQMAELGTAIAAARREIIQRLGAITGPLFGKGRFPQAVPAVEGVLESRLEQQAAIDVEDFFCNLLRRNREKDRLAGRSLEGPHRSDVAVFHREKNMPAGLCSTGEQKALLTGLILSHAYLTAALTGMTPVLLLDEIAAHLDKWRREALFAVLEDLRVQAFMTGTDKTLFSALKDKAEFIQVKDGNLEF